MPASTPGLSIFVLEDHEDTRNLLQQHLTRLGHSVLAAGSVREATMLIRRAELDVIVCDIGLADGLGWNFLESLHFAKPVFAIAVSGANTAEDVERSRRAGFRHHLVKPIDFSLLNQLLLEATAELAPSQKLTRKARNE